MSFEAQAWAAKIVLKSPSEKAVLNAMANCADEEGRCFPSFGYLERVTAWNRRTCIRATEALCNMGLLVKSARQRENGSNQSNEYILLLAVLEPKTVEDSAEKQVGDSDTVSLGVVSPCHPPSVTVSLLEASIELKDSLSRKLSTASTPDPDDLKLAEWMWGRVVDLKAGARKPNLHTWADVIRLMRERDRHTLHDIGKLFAWANRDPFWRANILCPNTLRKRWTQLWLKANYDKPATMGDDHVCETCKGQAKFSRGHRWFCSAHFANYQDA